MQLKPVGGSEDTDTDRRPSKVFVVGAGPGAADLITVRGARLIRECGAVLYTGSLVPTELLAEVREDADTRDSAGMDLDDIVAYIAEAVERGVDVVRLHTGDPSIYGSVAEQIRRLHKLGIDVEIVPGVSSFTAAAAALGRELTLPEVTQTVIVSRAEGRTPVPEREQLRELAKHRATMALFLSARLLKKIADELIPSYGAETPAAVVYRATWPDQKVVLGTLSTIAELTEEAGIRRHAMVLVGDALTCDDFPDSRLYASDFSHRYRKARRDEEVAGS